MKMREKCRRKEINVEECWDKKEKKKIEERVVNHQKVIKEKVSGKKKIEKHY